MQPVLQDALIEPFSAKDDRSFTIKTAHGHAQVVHCAKEIDGAVWEKALSSHCMDSRYYELIEASVPQNFEYRYAILTNQNTGEIAVQPFFFVKQDIVAGLPARIQSLVSRVREKFPRFLMMRILMVGCTVGEGQLDIAEPWAVDSLREAIDHYARKSKTGIILFKDFPADYRPLFAAFADKGYRRVPSMPAAYLDLNFTSFEDYIETKLSRIYRKSLRRKFRDSASIGELTMEVMNDVTPHVDEIYPLYLQTYNRSDLKFEKLTKEYLCLLGQRMPERVRYFLWRKEGRIVAFSICMIHDEILHDLNVGLDYSVALDLHLYFITWRDIVTWAINQKLKRYHTGPLNYDPKLHLKLTLGPQDLYVRHTSSLFNPIFGLAMKYLEPTRHDPVIQKFANAHEL